jgi:excisionase family DNA binding protein
MEMYLTVGELAVYLKIAEQTVRRWVFNRGIPYHKICGVVRFRVSEIEKWVDNGGAFITEDGDDPPAGTGTGEDGDLDGDTV